MTKPFTRRWYREYVVYLAIALPLIVADLLIVPSHSSFVVRWSILAAIIAGSMMLAPRIQRRWWP